MSEVVVERHGAVQVCRLNRPHERNALSGVLLGQYLEGDAFSAGRTLGDSQFDRYLCRTA